MLGQKRILLQFKILDEMPPNTDNINSL